MPASDIPRVQVGQDVRFKVDGFHGRDFQGKVARIVDFGAFVNILPGKDGLVHISQIANERIEKVTDYLTEGQDVRVKVLDVDNRGRIKLSMREVEEEAAPEQE